MLYPTNGVTHRLRLVVEPLALWSLVVVLSVVALGCAGSPDATGAAVDAEESRSASTSTEPAPTAVAPTSTEPPRTVSDTASTVEAPHEKTSTTEPTAAPPNQQPVVETVPPSTEGQIEAALVRYFEHQRIEYIGHCMVGDGEGICTARHDWHAVGDERSFFLVQQRYFDPTYFDENGYYREPSDVGSGIIVGSDDGTWRVVAYWTVSGIGRVAVDVNGDSPDVANRRMYIEDRELTEASIANWAASQGIDNYVGHCLPGDQRTDVLCSANTPTYEHPSVLSFALASPAQVVVSGIDDDGYYRGPGDGVTVQVGAGYEIVDVWERP